MNAHVHLLIVLCIVVWIILFFIVLHCARVDCMFQILALNAESCSVCRISQSFRNMPTHLQPFMVGALQPGKETAKRWC